MTRAAQCVHFQNSAKGSKASKTFSEFTVHSVKTWRGHSVERDISVLFWEAKIETVDFFEIFHKIKKFTNPILSEKLVLWFFVA